MSKLTAQIQTRQNEEWAIVMLSAQRQLYEDAKKFRRIRTQFAICLSIIGVIFTITCPAALPYIGPVGTIFGVIQWILILAERQMTKSAANVQEQFDTYVYDMDWNNILTGKRIDLEDISSASKRYKGSHDKLINWYSVPEGLSRAFSILICQRSNLRWDSDLRNAYARTILIKMVLLVLVIVAIGLLRHLYLVEFLWAFMPSSGALILGLDTFVNHRKHADDQVRLKREVEGVWAQGLESEAGISERDLREIQSGIYRLRVGAPPVPDDFYWSKRDQMEEQMQLAAQRMREQVQAAQLKTRRSEDC